MANLIVKTTGSDEMIVKKRKKTPSYCFQKLQVLTQRLPNPHHSLIFSNLRNNLNWLQRRAFARLST